MSFYEPAVEEMFINIASSNAIVKSQQRGEPEISQGKKIDILKGIYEKNKLTFVYKFGVYLKLEDLKNFSDCETNYELNFYIEKLKQNFLNPSTHDNHVKNRRYNYLKNILKNSDYFSEKELEKRDPLLYKQYIDQHKTKEDRLKEKEHNLANQSFSQFLFGTIDRDLNNFRCELELEAQENQEENDSEEELEDDIDFKKYLDGKVPISKEEKILFQEEFIQLMENRFLNGEDNFDYSAIDNNEEYDDYMDQDIEDKYFDED